MNAKAILVSLFSGVIFLLLALPAVSAAERLALQAGADRPGAQGEAVIRDLGAGQKEVVITARGLRPNEVYTVWLVNEKPRMDMAGLGTADYDFQSDSQGNGRYTATITGTDLDRWQLLKIAHHPDRNPRNMSNIAIDLETALK
jgi:hypothetical protein